MDYIVRRLTSCEVLMFRLLEKGWTLRKKKEKDPEFQKDNRVFDLLWEHGNGRKEKHLVLKSTMLLWCSLIRFEVEETVVDITCTPSFGIISDLYIQVYNLVALFHHTCVENNS